MTCVLAWLVLVGEPIMQFWHRGFEETDFTLAGAAVVAGLVVIGLFYGLCILLALIARKSRLALSITLTILAGFSAFGSSFTIVRLASTTNKPLAARLEQEAENIIDSLNSINTKNTRVENGYVDHDAIRAHANSLRGIAGQFKGKEGDHHRIFARYLENGADRWEEYNTALLRLHELWITTPTWAATQSDMELGKAAITQFQRANDRILMFFTNTSGSLGKCFVQERVDNAAMQQEILAGLIKAKNDLRSAIDMRITDQNLSTLLLDIHSFLDANWYDWEYSEDEDQMYFTTDALISEYNLLIKRLDEISQEQDLIQQQALQGN